jgi:histidinol-phosphatase (PHP family)
MFLPGQLHNLAVHYLAVMFSLDIDWHAHSTSSVDSKMTTIDACATAKQRGLKGICFTEHIDMDPRDLGFNFFKWDAYMKSIEAARRAHPSFEIKTGFELNWQRAFAPALLDFLEEKKVDLVLGSVHWLESGHICEKPTFKAMMFADFIDEWIHEALDLFQRDICQAFAHFDYFFWQGQAIYPALKREEIFGHVEQVVDAMIKHGVSLEVNTSALRKGLSEPFPSWDFIQKYFKAGGRRVHLGSDSHALGHIGLEFEATRRRVKSIQARYA